MSQRLNKGGKACKQGTWCDCKDAGQDGVCMALKKKGSTCVSSAECLTGACLKIGSAWKCSSPSVLDCGTTGYQCGDGMYCKKDTSCDRRKNVQEECASSEECRGGLACLLSGVVGGGLTCQPLFGRGYNQPCAIQFGECSWGMQCEAGRCAIYNTNQARTCSFEGDSVCEPYGVCQCSSK